MLKFLLGLFIGLYIGIILMCIFQVNKINEKDVEIWQQRVEIEELNNCRTKKNINLQQYLLNQLKRYRSK